MTINEPLALENLFINTFAGTMEIFVFVSIMFIAAVSARFRMPNIIFGLMIGLFAIIFQAYVEDLYVLVIMVGGVLTFITISNLYK
tara:strand:+ start:553 stop:810 length:258 start_codon:yes stop_codon:yes gene_type:complete